MASSDEDLIEFVDRIRRRGGLASLDDIFVKLITIHTKYYPIIGMDQLSAEKQLSKMWIGVQKKRDEITLFRNNI